MAGGAGLVRREDVDEVVWDEAAFFGGGVSGADVEAAVDGDGVAGDDLSGEARSEREREGRLAAGGRAGEDDERWIVLVRLRDEGYSNCNYQGLSEADGPCCPAWGEIPRKANGCRYSRSAPHASKKSFMAAGVVRTCGRDPVAGTAAVLHGQS